MLKYIRIIILFVILLQLSFHVKAQEVKINERIPDVLLQGLVKYGKSKINLRSEFAGKPLIIDFWFISCAACISAMPKLDALHKKYEGKFNVLMSTYERKEKVEDFLANKYALRNVSLPTTTRDTVLLKMFPHVYYPYEIWIDKNGVVQAITDHREVTEENIVRFINGEALHLTMIKEPEIGFPEASTKLFLDVDPKQTYQYSYIGGYQKKMSSQLNGHQENGLFGLKAVNIPLKGIYQQAYGLHGLKKSQFSYEKVDTTIFEVFNNSGKNLFCYDLMLNDTIWDHVYQYMQKDLDRYFKITSSVKNKPEICYVISKIKESVSMDTTDIVDGFTDYYKKDGKYVFSHATWQAVKVYVNREIADSIVDETGYNLDTKIRFLSIPLDWSNLEKVNQAIQRYNLKITRERREIPTLVFSPQKDNPQNP